MKKRINLILSLFILVGTSVSAQYYRFELKNEAYQPLENATIVGGDQNPSFFTRITLPFYFKYFGVECEQVELDDAFVYFDDVDAKYNNLYMFPINLDFRGYEDENGIFTTRLLHKIEGTGTNRIFKAEFKDYSSYNAPDEDRLSYQVWLYEADSKIEIRFGPQSLSSPVKNEPREVLLVSDFRVLTLAGDPNNPRASIADEEIIDGIPDSGIVYSFTPSPINQLKPTVSNTTVLSSAFPNPTVDYLNVQSVVDAKAMVFDLQGRLILETELKAGINSKIDLRETVAGLYHLRVLTESGVENHQIIKR